MIIFNEQVKKEMTEKVRQHKQEVLSWFSELDEQHRRKNTPYRLRKFFGERMFEIERGRELHRIDMRWIDRFGVKDFIKTLY